MLVLTAVQLEGRCHNAIIRGFRVKILCIYRDNHHWYDGRPVGDTTDSGLHKDAVVWWLMQINGYDDIVPAGRPALIDRPRALTFLGDSQQ